MKSNLLILFLCCQLPSRGQPLGPQQPITLQAANLSVTIDVSTGARVISCKVDDKELLGSSAIHSRFYGSSLWLSPEGKWKGMGALDTGPYVIKTSTAADLVVQSPADTTRGFSFQKEFRLNKKDTSVSIRYTITNTAVKDQDVAPWEVTRVPAGGLSFFPAGEHPALPKSDLKVIDSLGFVWYPYDSTSKDHQKTFRHGAEGWMAYTKEGTLFLKCFPVIGQGRNAPGEENVEQYVNPEKTYIELECQGAYETLKPGASLSYEVRWYARRLPDYIRPVIGDKALVTYARNLIHQL
jgi:hypothetical protein